MKIIVFFLTLLSLSVVDNKKSIVRESDESSVLLGYNKLPVDSALLYCATWHGQLKVLLDSLHENLPQSIQAKFCDESGMRNSYICTIFSDTEGNVVNVTFSKPRNGIENLSCDEWLFIYNFFKDKKLHVDSNLYEKELNKRDPLARPLVTPKERVKYYFTTVVKSYRL